ncbi:hypothetical protein AB0911_37965, partial [Streptomyces nigra]
TPRIINNRRGKSCRTRRPEAPLRSHEKGNGGGRTPELDCLAFIGSDADVAGLGGRYADFLPVLAARYAMNGTTDQANRRR